jgi:hypothetical protein
VYTVVFNVCICSQINLCRFWLCIFLVVGCWVVSICQS